MLPLVEAEGFSVRSSERYFLGVAGLMPAGLDAMECAAEEIQTSGKLQG